MLELQLKKLNSRYTAPPKIGLDWLNNNGNDGLAENKYQDLSRFPEKTTFVVHAKRKSKGRPFGSLQVDFTSTLQKKLLILICRTVSQPFS